MIFVKSAFPDLFYISPKYRDNITLKTKLIIVLFLIIVSEADENEWYLDISILLPN